MTWEWLIAPFPPLLGLWLGLRYMRSTFDAKACDPEFKGRYIGYRGTWRDR